MNIRQSLPAEMIAFRTQSNVRLEDFMKKVLIGEGKFAKIFLAELQGDKAGN